MEVLDKIKSELKAFEASRKVLVDQLKPEFPKLFAPVFELNPEAETLAFNQYTPHWNDGEETHFSANVGYDLLLINGEDYFDTEQFPKSVYEQFEAVLNEVPEEILKDLFGDHVEITINRDGSIQTEEYEHD